MAVVFKNNAKTTLAGNITTSATSITVTDGSIFPSLSGGDTFFCTFDDGTNNEIVSVTARSGNTLTVVRAQDSTTAKTFTAGDAAELRLTAGILNIFSQTGVAITDEIEAYLDANGTTFPDNVKAQFGAGNDLQILHTGGNSDIRDLGTGALRLIGTDIQFLNSDFSDFYAKFLNNGGVELYYNGSAKLATTSTGIDVTGTVTATGVYTAGNDAPIVTFQRAGGAVSGNIEYNDATTDMELGTTTSHSFSLKTANTRRLTIASGGNATFTGDITTAYAVQAGFFKIGSTIIVNANRDLTNIGTISSGAITATGDSAVGASGNISMSASSAGQLRIFGAGYTGSIALDGTTMAIYHNSGSRSLTLGTNETARITIGGSGGVSFNNNNLTSVGTISSGAITSTGTVTATGGNSTNWNTAYGWGNHASAGYLTSYTDTNTHTHLDRTDNRTISPSEFAAGDLNFGFTSYANNNTSPYADFIHMRSYTDSSGGSDNLVMFLKSGIGMRLWQQTFGSSTAYSNYEDVWHTGNLTTTNKANYDTAFGWGNHASASYATQSYVGTQISNLVDSSPAALNTLNELAAAIGDDASFSTTVTNNIAAKLPLAGGTLTGAMIQGYAAGTAEMFTWRNTTSGGKIQLGLQQNDSDGLHHRAYIKAYKGSATASGNVDLIVRGSGGSITSDVLELHHGQRAAWQGNDIFTDAYHPNADTLTTARTINGVSFNGSANITVADATKLPLAGGTMTGGLAITAGGNQITINGTSPTMLFNDTSGEDNFYIHINSNRFYVLTDRDASGSYESPHPLELNASNNIGYAFGSRLFTEDYHPNADTLTTARTIAGTSFNGSANIDISYNNLTNKPTIPQGDITGVTAGTGLTGGGTSGAVTLNVIGGAGITANANDIAVDSTVIRTTGDQSMSGIKTHTSRLALSSGQMLSLGDANHHLIKVTTGYSGATIDGPRLQGHQGGELATNIGSNQYSLRWDNSGNIVVRGDGYFNGSKLEGDSKEMIRYNDSWLRLNPANEFTSGIYCGTGILRTDGTFQVGAGGSAFSVTNAGNVNVAGTLGASGIVSMVTRAEIQGNGGWAYTRLLNGGSVLWDIASNPADNSGALQFRPSGGGTNATLMSTSGNWTFGGTIASGAITATNLTVNQSAHNYVSIEGNDGSYEAMTRYKNGLANYWYTGLRTSVGIAGTTGYHIYSTANGNDVGGYSTAGVHHVRSGYAVGATTVIDASRNLTVPKGDITTLNVLGNASSGYTNGSGQTLSGGLTLWGGTTTSQIFFKPNTSGSLGNHGGCTGDYHTYFVMDTTNRGWIFRNATTSTNVASISNTGIATFNGTISSGAITTPAVYLNNTNTSLTEGSGDALRISTSTGYIDIGSMNSSWIHFQGNKSYYFNQQLHMDANLYPYSTAGNRNLGGTNNIWNHVYAKGYFIDSTEVIDASRNLTNIADITVAGTATFNSNIYGKSVNGQYSNLYRFGGLYLTWDSDSYGTNFNHSLTSSDGGTYGDHITLNSFGNVRINFDSNSNGTNYFRIGHATTGTNNVLLTLDESGNGTFAGNVTAYSDIRLKENIVDVDNALNKVCSLRGVYYNMIEDITKSRRLGLVAQEVEKVLPEVVIEAHPEDDKDSVLSVDYGNIVALLIEGIKDQQKEIEYMKSEIKHLQENNNGNN